MANKEKKAKKAKPFFEPIDVVYTWVDGDDREWQAERNKYAILYQSYLNKIDSNTLNRYRNRDELKYSLRSVHQYASFVRHIFIVTNGQRPAWLKEHPKITVVTHEEIFKNKSDLPTFNSHAIEANLHRIPNLSEKFIYFNDDIFLDREVRLNDFFSQAGLIQVYLITSTVPQGPVVPEDYAYRAAWKNTDALLSSCFGQEKRYQLAHVPHAFTKSLVQEVENNFPKVFALVSSHKFRTSSDFLLTNGLIQYFAFHVKKAEQGVSNYFMVSLGDENNEWQFKKLKEYPCSFFCIQDIENEESVAVDKALQEFLTTKFPIAAPWEY